MMHTLLGPNRLVKVLDKFQLFLCPRGVSSKMVAGRKRPTDGRPSALTNGIDGPEGGVKRSIARLDQEADQIQAVLRQNKLNIRDQFGNLSGMRMHQPEAVQKGFQPDIWDHGQKVIRVVREREKTFRERLDDEFAEGRAKQVTEPLYWTVRHSLEKAERLKRWRMAKMAAAKQGKPIPPPPKIANGIITAKRKKAKMEASENAPHLELVPQKKPQVPIIVAALPQSSTVKKSNRRRRVVNKRKKKKAMACKNL